jgi:hypothetical protein
MAYKWRFKSRETFCTIFSGIQIWIRVTLEDTTHSHSYLNCLVRAHSFAWPFLPYPVWTEDWRR